MERGEVAVLRGQLPEWAVADGYGNGDGDGDGDGYGSGDGDGYGSGDGDGSGYGYGSGDGDGYGSGDGDGYGSGDGYGYGSGDGDGYGYGDGYGDGYGSGYGYGDGYGSGYGNGSGYGDGSGYYKQIAASIVAAHSRPNASVVAFWKSDKKGLPSNGGTTQSPVSVGLIEEINGPLRICSHGFHATMNPEEWKGERLWVVALYGEVQQEGNKWAALKREILGEIPL